MRNIKCQIFLIMIVLLTTSTMGRCNSMNQAKETEPIVLEWDLSKSHNIKDVGWAADNNSDVYARSGNIFLTMKLPNNRIFKERLTFFDCHREGNKIPGIVLHLPNRTIDEAYQEAQRMIDYWKLPYKDLDEWYAGVKSGDFQKDEAFYSIRNDIYPGVEMNVRHSFNDEKPWFVLLSLSFRRLEDTKKH